MATRRWVKFKTHPGRSLFESLATLHVIGGVHRYVPLNFFIGNPSLRPACHNDLSSHRPVLKLILQTDAIRLRPYENNINLYLLLALVAENTKWSLGK